MLVPSQRSSPLCIFASNTPKRKTLADECAASMQAPCGNGRTTKPLGSTILRVNRATSFRSQHNISIHKQAFRNTRRVHEQTVLPSRLSCHIEARNNAAQYTLLLCLCFSLAWFVLLGRTVSRPWEPSSFRSPRWLHCGGTGIAR